MCASTWGRRGRRAEWVCKARGVSGCVAYEWAAAHSHLLRRNLAVGDVRIDGIVDEHLDVDVGLGREPLNELEDRLVVQHERDRVVHARRRRVLERLLRGARRRVARRGAQQVGVELGRRLAVDAAATVAREVLLLPRRVRRVDQDEADRAVAGVDQLGDVAKLLVQQPGAERRDDERRRRARREAGERLVDDRLEGGVAAVGVAEAPELAAVAVALAEVGDRVLEEPLLEIGGAAAADVDELLAELGVQLFQGVVVVVVGALQPLRDELVGVEVERLQQRGRRGERCGMRCGIRCGA